MKLFETCFAQSSGYEHLNAPSYVICYQSGAIIPNSAHSSFDGP
jgi:hypothetical protein